MSIARSDVAKYLDKIHKHDCFDFYNEQVKSSIIDLIMGANQQAEDYFRYFSNLISTIKNTSIKDNRYPQDPGLLKNENIHIGNDKNMVIFFGLKNENLRRRYVINGVRVEPNPSISRAPRERYYEKKK